MTLLSVSPLHTLDKCGEEDVEDDDEEKAEEAANFTSETHAAHIRDIFKRFYNMDLDEKDWITNQTADNVSSNKKLARLLKIAHVSCESHLLNNEVKLWLKETAGTINGPGYVCDKVHETMIAVKNSNKNASCLRKETNLKATIGNKTRWTGQSSMMKKWEKIENPVKEASNHDDSDIVLPPSTKRFKNACKKTKYCFDDIHAVTVALQERGLNLHDCRKLQDDLLNVIDDDNDDETSHWYEATFGGTYIPSDSKKRPDQDFLDAVCKYQGRQTDKLNKKEKRAVARWAVKKKAGNEAVNKEGTLAARMSKKKGSVKDKDKKRKAESCANDDEIFDHVMGTAAEVERMWSVARYVLTTQRARMSPIMFETILYLKFNRELWDERTVQRAHNKVIMDKRNERVNKRSELARQQEEEMEAEEEADEVLVA